MRNYYLNGLFVLLLILNQFVFAQNNNVHAEFSKNNVHDTIKIKQLNESAHQYIKEGSEKGLGCAKQAYFLATKNKFAKGQIDALINMSRNYIYVKENFDSSIFFLKAATVISKNEKSDALEADLFKKIGTAYLFKGNSDSSLFYLFNSLAILEKLKDSTEIIRVRNNIGNVYYKIEKFDKAIAQFFISLRFNEARKDSAFISSDYNNIGTILKSKLDFSGARTFLGKAMKIRIERGDSVGIAEIYNNLGNVYLEEKKYNLALEEYYKGLSYIDVSETKSLYYKFINNIAICYGNLNQPAKELEYYQKVLDVLKEIGSTDDYSDIYVNIASCYFSLGNYSQAIEYNKKALEYAKKAGQLVTQRIAYKSLVKSYIKSNEKEKALEALHNFVLIEDSISTSNSNREIQDIKIRYETEKKEAENKLLSQKNELGEAKIKSKNRLITGLVTGIVLVVILVLLLLTIARLRKNRNELKNILLVQQERERISRDLHDSVGGQLSYVLFSLEGISNKQEEEKLKNISSAVRNVIGDLRQTIWAMNEKNLSVQSLSDKLKVYARSLFNNTDVKIVFDECIEHDLFKSSTVMLSLFRACQEIINNAFKHSNCNELTIRILSNNNITIEIQDNGIGFDTQKETSETYGLLNIKARINEINGSVEVFSKDKGTYYKIIV